MGRGFRKIHLQGERDCSGKVSHLHRLVANGSGGGDMSEIKDRALEWLLSGSTGVSSETLCAHMLGLTRGHYSSPPSDAGDRSRCIQLLNKIPEWWDRLDELKDGSSPERLVISGRGINVERNGWAEQIPLIRKEANKLKGTA